MSTVTFVPFTFYDPPKYLAPTLLGVMPVEVYADAPDWLLAYVIADMVEAGCAALPTVIEQELRRRENPDLYYAILAPRTRIVQLETVVDVRDGFAGPLPDDKLSNVAINFLVNKKPDYYKRLYALLTQGPLTQNEAYELSEAIARWACRYLTSSGRGILQPAVKHPNLMLTDDVREQWLRMVSKPGEYESELMVLVSGMLSPEGYLPPRKEHLKAVFEARLGPTATEMLAQLSHAQWQQLLAVLGADWTRHDNDLEHLLGVVVPTLQAV